MKREYKNIYFVGIGGIGMSAIARYFVNEGCAVAGYDKTATRITDALIGLGISINFDDSMDNVPNEFLNISNTLVVYTPAIPQSHEQLNYFINNNFEVVKRSKILGVLSEDKFLMAVSGTHGKTSTSTMLAHFNHVSTHGAGSAFLGGISKNYNSNLLLGTGDRLTVEADEFDRSFLQLYPNIALVTSTDADHLDIYNNHNTLKDTFSQFVGQIKSGGTLICRYGVDLLINNDKIKTYTYSLKDNSDFYAQNIVSVGDGTYCFDIVCCDKVIRDCHLGAVGLINVENCVGAVAMLWVAGGYDEELLREAIASYRGVNRRLEIYINTPSVVYIDDYAHHPKELESTILSIKDIFPGRKITAIFQPHLFTRTRDFVDGFAQSLSLCDKVILLPIYPARELPIEGVDSTIILNKITCQKMLVDKNLLIDKLSKESIDILVTFGAGDIDVECAKIYEMLKNRIEIE